MSRRGTARPVQIALEGDVLEERIVAAAAAEPVQRLRVLVGDGGAPVEIEATPLDGEPQPEPALLVPVYLPGGLGPHNWRDRRLVDLLGRCR
jgi:hypothetical protein